MENSAVGKQRDLRIDAVRGLVIVLMALDHVRNFFVQVGNPIDLAAPENDLAYAVNRWLTHFCAPGFSLLAGVGAWLWARRGRTTAELSTYLITRGLWLLLLEFTLVRWGWGQGGDGSFFLMFVLASIGVSFVALAGLVWLPHGAIAAVAAAILVLHNLTDGVPPERFGAFAGLWKVLHAGGEAWSGELLGRRWQLAVAYPVLSWIGICTLGYALAPWIARSDARSRTRLVALGLLMTGVFVALRWNRTYGDRVTWAIDGEAWRTVMAFLSCTKYPPSLQYTLMTVGPILVLLGALAPQPNWLKEKLAVFGRVPLFFYLIHAPILRYAADLYFLAWPPAAGPSRDLSNGMWYALFAATIVLLYWPCLAMAKLKSRGRPRIVGWL